MVKKQKLVRSFARTAPKSQEKHLIENAKQLQKNPFLILPLCSDDCKKYFHKQHKQIKKIQQACDDEERLEKLANKKGVDGALAGTLLLAFSEKAPYLAVLKFSTADVTYAQRGKADKELLIAVQHFNDPMLRLLGVKHIAQKKKLYVYSWNSGFFCSGKTPQPPTEFITFIAKKLGLTQKDNTICCPHITPTQAAGKQYLEMFYLRIHWKSVDTTIAICKSCASATKNTMYELSKYMLAPQLSFDFDIDIIAQVIRDCPTLPPVEIRFLHEYLSGQLTDLDFIGKNIQTREDCVKQSTEKIYVLDGVSYGSDMQRFIQEVHPSDQEKTALEFILQQVTEPVVFSHTTPNKILEKYWEDYGKALLDSIVGDSALTASLFNLEDTPSALISLAYESKQRRMILSQLPTYRSLPPLACFADTVARAYRMYGESKALAEIKKHSDSSKEKSIAYAFLLCLGKATELKWKYSAEEIEYGEYLKDYAKKLLDVSPEQYHAALQELLTVSGSSEKIS